MNMSFAMVFSIIGIFLITLVLAAIVLGLVMEYMRVRKMRAILKEMHDDVMRQGTKILVGLKEINEYKEKYEQSDN